MPEHVHRYMVDADEMMQEFEQFAAQVLRLARLLNPIGAGKANADILRWLVVHQRTS